MLPPLPYLKMMSYSTVLCGCALLSACSPASGDNMPNGSAASASLAVHSHTNDGQKLMDVAGKSSMPAQNQQPEVHHVLTQQEKHMVGRYIVTISCIDRIARCETGKKGSVEYIINLMDDGSVFRLIKSFGKIYADTRMAEGYQEDHWEVVSEQQKQYVLVHFNTGLKFYYLIDAKGNLMMDSQRNFAVNHRFFEQGHPYTLNDYYLERAQN